MKNFDRWVAESVFPMSYFGTIFCLTAAYRAWQIIQKNTQIFSKILNDLPKVGEFLRKSIHISICLLKCCF